MNAIAAAFDRLAGDYDRVWTFAPAGLAQRQAVWGVLDPLLEPGMRVLDLGCGTGEDAARMQLAGLEVDAIDASPQMVARAHAKGVRAQVMSIEKAYRLRGPYDLVLSNFGALNCVSDLSSVGRTLSRIVRPGGRLALCLLNRFCLWETIYLALQCDWRRSTRRLRGTDHAAIGVRVRYYSERQVCTAFGDVFELEEDRGIGIFTPPSFVPPPGDRWMTLASRIDRPLAKSFFGRGAADHRLFVFRRAR